MEAAISVSRVPAMLRMLQFAEPTIATSSSMMSSLLCTYTMKRRFAIACKAYTAWTCGGLIAYTQGRKICKSSHIDETATMDKASCMCGCVLKQVEFRQYAPAQHSLLLLVLSRHARRCHQRLHPNQCHRW